MPKADVRKVGGQETLRAGVDGAAGWLPGSGGTLFDQPIHLGVGIAAPVGADGGAVTRVESQAEDVRIVDLGPHRDHHLEPARLEVVVESRPLVGADVDPDADARQLLLDDGGLLQRQLAR
jgi:hypothetical protein